eukprot:8577148-Pyramimonas_sp.AAC.1
MQPRVSSVVAQKLRDLVCYGVDGGSLTAGQAQLICAVNDTVYLCAHVWYGNCTSQCLVRPKMAQNGPKTAKMAHDGLQDVSKTAKVASKTAKVTPRCIQDGLKIASR